MTRASPAAPTCAHSFTVEVMAHLVPGKPTHRLTICRNCHRVPGLFATSRWKPQDDEPVLGAHLTPWMFDAGAAKCFKVPQFMGDKDPPMLIPTVDSQAIPFDCNARVGDRVAFLASIGLLQWIEGRVVFIGTTDAGWFGTRGIVATTEQGLVLRGSAQVGGSPACAYWGLDFIGDEEHLAEIISIHREAYPAEVLR